MYKITVDKTKCIGCGACVAQCPENFEIKNDGENKAYVKKAKISELGCNKDAEEVCPVDAIKIEKI